MRRILRDVVAGVSFGLCRKHRHVVVVRKKVIGERKQVVPRLIFACCRIDDEHQALLFLCEHRGASSDVHSDQTAAVWFISLS